MTEKNELSFEKAIEQLETIVKQLENDEIPLEKAIKLYEEGMNLTKACDDILEKAQEKITYILNENGETIPFEGEE